MPLSALIALFIVVPLAELYVILKVGDAIGAAWTILLLAADSVLGSVLLRSQGRSVWRRFNAALAEGRMPHREVRRRRARDLRRRLPDHARLPHRHRRPDPAAAADARRDPARPDRAGSAGAASAARDAGRTTTWRARPASTTTPRHRGSSGERSGARAVLLRRRPRHPRDGALRRDDPVRGQEARRAARRGPRSSRRRAAGAPSWRARSSLELEPVAPPADLGGVRAHVDARARRGRRDARSTASGPCRETDGPAELGRARRAARHLRARGRAARAARARAAARAAPWATATRR